MDIYVRLMAWSLDTYRYALVWFEKYILDYNLLIEIFLFLSIMYLLKILQRKISPWLNDVTPPRLSDFIHVAIKIPKDQLCFLILLPFSTHLVDQVLSALDISVNIFTFLAPLVTAWSLVRVFQTAIDSSLMGVIVSWTVWGLAAFNILSYTAISSKFLKNISFKMGSHKITLLGVIESFIILTLIFWVVGLFMRFLKTRITHSQKISSAQKILFLKLSRGVIYTVAALYGLNLAGVDLTTITVFSGAIGFGLGFGLKQVISNLISGIILLLDRSIKPGDVIALGDTFGKVTLLEPRYVSVETLDGRNHLVPNEFLIANTVENWSFGNKRVCIGVPVGVSYASDIPHVRSLMLKIAANHERVLDTPEPHVMMNNFADSAIELELRVWIEDPSKGYKRVKSDLMYAIWAVFKEHNIVIPYPQRDMHIKSGTLKQMG